MCNMSASYIKDQSVSDIIRETTVTVNNYDHTRITIWIAGIHKLT